MGLNATGLNHHRPQAVGNVTSTANNFAYAGGLVGLNSGTITSTTQPGTGSKCAIGASFSCAHRQRHR